MRKENNHARHKDSPTPEHNHARHKDGMTPEHHHALKEDKGIQEERIDAKREQPCPPGRWSDSERNMNTKSMGRFFSCLLFCVLVFLHSSGWSEEKVLNLYSSRHYESDQAVYDEFTRRTGIVVRRIEGSSDALLERIIREGANSPADVFMTVDAARLYRAEQADVFLPVSSHTLETRIPSNLRPSRRKMVCVLHARTHAVLESRERDTR